MVLRYLDFLIRRTTYIIIPTTSTTRNIPTPTPALNISPITEQLENIVIMEIRSAVMNVCFFIAPY